MKNGALWEMSDADGSWEQTAFGCNTMLLFQEDWILLKWSLRVDGK